MTVHKSLYVGVISNNLKSTDQAVHSTWGQAAVKLEYFVNNDIHTEFAEADLPSKEMRRKATNRTIPISSLYNNYNNYNNCLPNILWSWFEPVIFYILPWIKF